MKNLLTNQSRKATVKRSNCVSKHNIPRAYSGIASILQAEIDKISPVYVLSTGDSSPSRLGGEL
jgi:hypothetical protein